MCKYKAMYKSELARAAGVTSNTLRSWLNRRYYQELLNLGYCKTDALLPPNIVKYICEKLVISLEQ